MQKGFKFDLNYCTGCQACTIACIIENNLPYQKSWRRIFTFNERHYPRLPLFHLSMACNHCIDPACLKYCPALAYNKNDETGAVTINADLCIGCKYCSWVCPWIVKLTAIKTLKSACTGGARRAKARSPG